MSERSVEKVAQLAGLLARVPTAAAVVEGLRLWKDRPRVRQGLVVRGSEGGLLSVGGEVQSGIRGLARGRGVVRRRGSRRGGRPTVGRLNGRAKCLRFGLVRRLGRGPGPVGIVWGQWRGEIWHFGVTVGIGFSVVESIVTVRYWIAIKRVL